MVVFYPSVSNPFGVGGRGMKKENLEMILSSVCGYPCVWGWSGSIPAVDVFNVPDEDKEHVRELIYRTLNMLECFTGEDMFAAVVVVSIEETKKYYSEKVEMKMPDVPELTAKIASLVRDEIEKELGLNA